MGWVSRYVFNKWRENKALAATAIVLRAKDEILILRRKSGARKGTWEVPGGTIERFETPIDAIIRELWEETGIEINNALEIGVFTGNFVDATFIVVAFMVYVEKQDVIPNEEFDAWEWVNISKLGEYNIIPFVRGIIKKGLES